MLEPILSAPGNQHYYIFYLFNGELSFRFNGGTKEVGDSFAGLNVSDGEYHVVTMTKNGRRIGVQLDDSAEVKLRLESTQSINIPKQGGLFVGGSRKFYFVFVLLNQILFVYSPLQSSWIHCGQSWLHRQLQRSHTRYSVPIQVDPLQSIGSLRKC